MFKLSHLLEWHSLLILLSISPFAIAFTHSIVSDYHLRLDLGGLTRAIHRTPESGLGVSADRGLFAEKLGKLLLAVHARGGGVGGTDWLRGEIWPIDGGADVVVLGVVLAEIVTALQEEVREALGLVVGRERRGSVGTAVQSVVPQAAGLRGSEEGGLGALVDDDLHLLVCSPRSLREASPVRLGPECLLKVLVQIRPAGTELVVVDWLHGAEQLALVD